MVDILSAAGDTGAQYDTSSWVYLYPDSDEMYKNPPGSRSAVSLQDSFDAMSERQLEEYGIQRVNPSELSEQTIRQSRFDLRGNKPTYVKSFNMDIEFGAENGTVFNSSITKKQ